MKSQKISELVKCPEFSGFPGKYRKATAAYIEKPGDCESVLVGFRYNPDDPARNGCLAFPCGRQEEGETYEATILREVEEETGIKARHTKNMMFSSLRDAPFLKEYGPVVTLVDTDGMVYIFARDSRRRLAARAFVMEPLSEPRKMPGSDLVDPHYTNFEWLLQNQLYVMPEEGFMLDTVGKNKHLLSSDTGKIKIDPENFAGFIREAVSL